MQQQQRRLGHMSALTVTILATAISCVTPGSDPPVNCTVTRAGGRADLTCRISSLLDVVLVTWKKRTGDSYQTLVTRSRRFGVKISKSYENRISAPQTKDLGKSTIALSELENEDDACFMVIFNIYPDGALKGDVCLPKPLGVREVVCKSPSDLRIIVDPPEIKTQQLELDGVFIQKVRWLNDPLSPMCSFQLQEKARSKRSVSEKDEVFTIECEASGEQKPTITWTDEGRPISIEDNVKITGDVITVTSTRRHVWSTFPKDKNLTCHISYNQSTKGISKAQEGDLRHEEILSPLILGTIIPSIAFFIVVIVVMYWHFSKNKKMNSPKKYNNAEKGLILPNMNPSSEKTPSKSPIITGSPGTEPRQRSSPENKETKTANRRLFK
ncbi:uncharacterized protein [Engystomops pustulosus]|uniref:uncharacterized protein n=1 Tax=Engystomops pustulosus TaxID=76066 RepID=UPI003AFB0B75